MFFEALCAEVPEVGRVLEIGCGHALVAATLALRSAKREVVGYDPKVPFREGLEKTFAWFRLPPEQGKRWDRSMDPAVPTSVDIVRDRRTPSDFPWRTFPWHPNLYWVVQCRHLSAQQVEFLRRVHDGFVNGTFRESVPLKYRSLQLTGDEKMLASLATTSLFGPTRLTLELLACLPDALPLAWEAVGDGGRMVIFENAGSFAVARRVLVPGRDR